MHWLMVGTAAPCGSTMLRPRRDRPRGRAAWLPPGCSWRVFGAHDPAAPDYLSRFGAHGRPLQRHHPGLAIHDPLRQASGGALSLGQATAALSGKCCSRWNSRHGEASNPHFRPMPPKPPGRKQTCQRLAAPGRIPGAVWSSVDRRMALHFSRVAPATEELEIWSAIELGYSFVISNESRSGPGLHGQPGFVASWRPINFNRTAIRVGGSPFKTFAEAEKACEAMLVHLIK